MSINQLLTTRKLADYIITYNINKPYNHILDLGLQKGNSEPIYFLLDINV